MSQRGFGDFAGKVSGLADPVTEGAPESSSIHRAASTLKRECRVAQVVQIAALDRITALRAYLPRKAANRNRPPQTRHSASGHLPPLSEVNERPLQTN